MKQLHRYTSFLLRTVLLLGAIIFANTKQAQAQTAEQLAAMPNAFETVTPVIGDGNYYYIQFYYGGPLSYLIDRGLNKKAWVSDFLPTNSRLWTLVPAGENQFKLLSKEGNYLGWGAFEGSNRYGSVDNYGNAVTFTLRQEQNGYNIYDVNNNGLLSRYENNEWTDLPYRDDRQSHRNWACMHFVKLKSNSAFIIYYRGEHADGNDNSSANASTTRHYLTYSGTGNETPGRDWSYRDSEVSFRRSIIPSDKPLYTLPTLAAYHQDGLWTLESTGVDGQFYIKKYGTEEYLNLSYVQGGDGFRTGVLGVKDNLNGNYTLVDHDANRYSLIQNVKYNETSLASYMFYNWTGYGANPTQGSSAQNNVDFNTNRWITAEDIASGFTLVGTGLVDHQIYADLTNYSKMVIRGTQGVQLRVLMNRQEDNNGPYVERDVTIGSDGTAVVDLTRTTVSKAPVSMTYIDGSDDKVGSSYGVVTEAVGGYNSVGTEVGLGNKAWGVNNLIYLKVDASAIPGRISKVTLKAKASGSTDGKRNTTWGAGFNNSVWSSSLTWNTADRSITDLTPTNRINVAKGVTDQQIELDITGAFTDDADKIATILVYETMAAGGIFKDPVVEVEYIPNENSYTHLNAIKIGWGSPAGTIYSIGLMSENTGNTNYLHHAKGDGWQLMEWSGNDNDDNYFYAGFYPVEVPVPNKDEFFQVQVRMPIYNNSPLLNYNGATEDYSEEKEKSYLWQLEQVDDYLHFRLKNPNNGTYLKGVNQVTEPNNPEGAEINTNQKFWTDFSLKWYFIDPTAKEIVVDKMVTHKISYLQQYAQAGLDKQGLATDKDSDWKNEDGTQKTNHFEITHYVKRGNTITVEFPTVLNWNNDHIYYQRFYNYDEPDGSMDLDNLKDHVSLDTRDDGGDVQYFLYRNGMVTGQKLKWKNNDGTDIPNGGMARNVLRRFNFTNSDGNAITVAADVSRYSDMTYQYPNAPQTGDLEEPSLTMRYIYHMYDAKVMAASLSSYTEQLGVENATTWKENFTGGEDAKTVFLNDDNWKESKVFHFPAKPVAYEDSKLVGYRGEFIGLKHVFSDYWVFDGNGTGDDNLVSAVNNASGGKIEVRIYDPNETGIRLGGWNPTVTNLKSTTDDGNSDKYEGFYLYDMMANKTSYGDSRFVVFRYPEGGVSDEKTGKKAYIHVYLNNNGTRYQLAQFTLIFDKGAETIPYTSVKDSDRDPKRLRVIAGRPIAKITFDYPVRTSNNTYKTPSSGYTKHNGGEWGPGVEIDSEIPAHTDYKTSENSSSVPLTFDNTNYSFDVANCNWGSYALVSSMYTIHGNNMYALPASDNTAGYGIGPETGLQSGFLYIDASEQPGNICSAEFQGEFCASDKLMCSGWISGSNIVGGERCPGGVTLTVTGERIDDGVKETIYRFCPGQCYELDNESGVVWQQFYFVFGTTKKYKRYWMEVNNNCVSSNGGDFMLDNVEVFALVPEVKPEMNTPICVHKDASEMQLLKINIGFDKILAAYNNTSEATGDEAGEKKDISFVFLKKDLFLAKFLEELNKAPLNFGLTNVEELEENIERGVYENLMNTNENYKAAYKKAFDAAILGDDTKVWDSDSYTEDDLTAAVLNYHWSTKFSEMETYSFAKAVNGQGSVFRETDPESGERFIVINGNYPNKLPWKADTEYYVVPYTGAATITNLYEYFDICSPCCKKAEFKIDPPLQILSMEASDVTEELVVCEGKIPTLLTNLKGYNINGELVSMTGLNFDWWLGSETTLATLDNYHSQTNGSGVRLDEALYILRIYYPDVTSLDGVVPRSPTNTKQTALHVGDPELTQDMIDYLKVLVNSGQLILHQSSISIPAKKADGDNDPYFYLVACPIHDAAFDQALNYDNNKYVAYFCDEPQGFRIKVGEKAPILKCGFVPGENGFDSYSYPDSNPILSIRLAKKAQFENVKHGTTTDTAVDDPAAADLNDHFLWLPIRDAEVQSTGSTKVIQKSNDYNVYLASTDDPIWDKEISKIMNRDKELPIFGKIVKLEAVNKSAANTDQTSNRLCIYFIEYGDTDAEKEKYDVREGYSYTLSLPFKENGANTCDGTILINVKIVPDYEVWTGGAGNTDWNNDQNWRRADGNLTTSTTESPDGSKRNNNELYRTSDLPDESPLKDYVTNYTNYRTAKDRILRKGFAPLYCTHVLMKSNEWGNAPVLYDALDDAGSLSASPFPNLRDTSTPILKFDMQARHYEKWSEVYGSSPDKGREGDLIAEMYQINSCDEIAFQPGAELLNAHLLNYNNAWVEYKLDMKRWYLLGSPLQGTISGEWYAPTGTAQQKTTYYENVTFGSGYDRYSPAIYQRSWDKAKAVLYEVGASYSTGDNPDDLALTEGQLPGSVQQGTWSGTDWSTTGADDYLDRLGYKPMGGKKANVAMKGIWSNTYNDATVDYTKGGFSVMVLNNLKGGSNDNPAIIRLPKEDVTYKYWTFNKDKSGTDTNLSGVQNDLNRAKNRGRLKTDLLLPESTYKIESAVSRYGDARTYTRIPTKVGDGYLPMTLQSFPESVSPGISDLGYYLVENPFPCGMNMKEFFDGNTGLEKKYWLLTATGQHLVQHANDTWITQTGTPAAFETTDAVVAPGQGFFVQATTPGQATTITFTKAMQDQSRYGVPDEGENFEIVVGTKQVMKTILVTYDDDDDPDTPEVPLMIEDENNPGSLVQATMEVPEVDNLGNYVVEDITEDVTIYSYKQKTGDGYQYPLKARTRSGEANLLGLVITAQRDNNESSALVMQREEASNDFLPEEDTEVFINSDLEYVPTVYTLCGRLATTINSIHDFHCLPLGVESSSDAPCTLTFKGVEMLGDSIAFYDALEQKLTPLESGMKVTVSGQTQNRYYLVRSLIKEEAAAETHIQIFTKDLVATVIASTAEPITNVRCFDTAGRLVYSASPQTAEYSFNLPAAGIYIIEAQTEADHKTKKVMTK